MGIVILANKNCPIDDRITVAYQIFSKLGAVMPPSSGSRFGADPGFNPTIHSQLGIALGKAGSKLSDQIAHANPIHLADPFIARWVTGTRLNP